MSVITSISLLLLACVFGLAGVAKLLDRAGTRQAVQGFGVPPRVVGAVAVVVPLVELAIAALLVPAATA
ncbi:MAG TPA: MauE/DoxX family redox-associated membrane protein, partial [Solirubrobacteraceae bacterium]|nr:MauE/DoxX family redox-associated membrane protein [Solirubrobacteraceae bacterium]